MINNASLFCWAVPLVCIHFLFQMAALMSRNPSFSYAACKTLSLCGILTPHPRHYSNAKGNNSNRLRFVRLTLFTVSLGVRHTILSPLHKWEIEARRCEMTYPGSHEGSEQIKKLNTGLTSPELIYWPLCQLWVYFLKNNILHIIETMKNL